MDPLSLSRTHNFGQLKAISDKRQKCLETRYKELEAKEKRALELKDSISTISARLKKKRDDEKDARVSSTRIISHNKALALDFEKRPSDRDSDIRTYSKMDLDIWRYDQVRNWFNTYATNSEPYKFIPSQTGYTLKADND